MIKCGCGNHSCADDENMKIENDVQLSKQRDKESILFRQRKIERNRKNRTREKNIKTTTCNYKMIII